MKFSVLTFFAVIACYTGAGSAAALPGTTTLPPPAAISAQNFLLLDVDSGDTLAEQGADQRVAPAGLTRLMTAYVVEAQIQAGNLKRDEQVTIKRYVKRKGKGRRYTRVTTQVDVEELFKRMTVLSHNSATTALAVHIGGSEIAFATLMNQYAQRLGMTHSHFTNSTGRSDPGHYTTARDLATLTLATIENFPASYQWYAAKEFTYNGKTYTSRNKLLWTDPSMDGLKTGYIDSKGFGLAAAAKKYGMHLVSIALGSNNTNASTDESERLLDYGFLAFETHRLYVGQQTLAETVIWKGEKKKVSLGLMSDLFITIPRGQYQNLNAALDMSEPIVAPAGKGQQMGSIKVKLGDRIYAEQVLVSLEPVAPGGFVNNAVDDMKLLFESKLGIKFYNHEPRLP